MDHNALADLDRRALGSRALAYSQRCERWLEHQKDPDPVDITDPLTTVRRFAPFIPLQIRENHAEVALVAIEHSRTAWLALVKLRAIRPHLAEPFVSDLVWLKHEVERVFPNVRHSGQIAGSEAGLDILSPL